MENMILMIVITVLPLILIVLGVLCSALLYKPLKKLCIRLMIRKNAIGLIAVFLLTMPMFFVGLIAIFGATAQIRKEKDALYSKITISPSDQAVDELIANIEKYGCVNDPNSWNKLRSVWITINESPNVSTEKKKQLKQFLMLQGLTMHYQDAKIIDNCKL